MKSRKERTVEVFCRRGPWSVGQAFASRDGNAAPVRRTCWHAYARSEWVGPSGDGHGSRKAGPGGTLRVAEVRALPD